MQKTLPRRPSLDHLRHQTKDLLKQLRQHDPSALDRLRTSHPEFKRASEATLPQTTLALNHAQLVIAREYGFASWTRLKHQVELLELDERDRLETFVTSALVDHRDPKAANFEHARMILEAEPDIVHATFHSALVAGEVEDVKKHLHRDPELAKQKGGPKNWEPLLYVCFSRFFQRDKSRTENFAEIVRALLARGADPNAYFMVNDDPNARQTCLYGAAGIANNAAITKLLLDASADPNDAASGLGPESLYHSAEHTNVECLRLILEAKPDAKKVSYCLGRCLDFENPAGVKLFLEAGADPNAMHPGGGHGSTRLHGAIRNGCSAEVIQLLLEAGADWARKNWEGMTSYRLAVRTGHQEAVKLMESRGADPKLATVIDRFLGECLQANYDSAKEILNANPDLLRRMRPDDLAMIAVASYLRRSNAVKAMLLLGFPIDTYGPKKMSALHWACWVGDIELAQFLVERAANLELRNGYGGTVLGCTVWAAIHQENDTDYAPLVQLLLKNGAAVKDTCNYPTGIADIDSLLKAQLEKETTNSLPNPAP
jgi:ankyrin repeat protein